MKKRVYFMLVLLLAIIVGIYYYAVFPSINIHEVSFWITAVVISLLLACIFMLNKLKDGAFKGINSGSDLKLPLLSKVFLVVTLACVIVFAVGSVMSAQFFRAKSYASILTVDTRDFASDIEESSQVTDIALMDTESARIFGNRKIGSLSEVVSQYEVENDYSQISIDKTPMKVSALKYASFFKWFNNRDKGVPGYVKVNPINSNAEYVELEKGMKYVPSAYLNYNLQRHVQLEYPTKIINGYYFEVDDEGKPYYICPTISARIGLFGGMDVNGIIMCDPVSGDCSFYKSGDIPSWVDNVYDGHLLTRKYNWFGTLSDGYINSVFGQKNCKRTTDDFGYKIIGDDVWMYTGVTSVNGDQSNIGFVMMNQRTSEARYYKVSGAEEHSAMSAAEGEVQEKGYKASFPSLINVAGVPTYIMVLKDEGGLVKMYAMVNVSQYNIVSTASSQTKVFAEYKKLLAEKGAVSQPEKIEEKTSFIVKDIRFIDTEDGTVVYIKDSEHNVYKQAFKDNESLIKINEGDNIEVSYQKGDDGINYMTDFIFI